MLFRFVSPTAIMSFAPHPSAARLFTDFTFTREIQQVMADSEGLYTGHPEVTYPADKPKLHELKLLTVGAEELEKRNEEIKRKFVEFFGAQCTERSLVCARRTGPDGGRSCARGGRVLSPG